MPDGKRRLAGNRSDLGLPSSSFDHEDSDRDAMRSLDLSTNGMEGKLRYKVLSWKSFLRPLIALAAARAGFRGIDVFIDLRKRGIHIGSGAIVDVGANHGEFIDYVRRRLDRSVSIFAVEPSRKNAVLLRRKFARTRNISVRQVALAAKSGQVRFADHPLSSKRSRISTSGYAVPALTLDEFCLDAQIDEIAFLKIDTEGGDLDVLRGARSQLRAHKIACIQVECGMNPRNELHAKFEDIKAFLEDAGYRLFAIYEQVHEWPTCEPQLRRTDAVYIQCAPDISPSDRRTRHQAAVAQ